MTKKEEQELKRQRKLQAELERLSKINTNWYDEIFKLAHTQNYIVSLSGGSEKTQYYFSMNYMNQGGGDAE